MKKNKTSKTERERERKKEGGRREKRTSEKRRQKSCTALREREGKEAEEEGVGKKIQEKKLHIEKTALLREQDEGRVESTNGANECLVRGKMNPFFFTFPSCHPSILPPFLCERPSRVVSWLSLWVISSAACHFSGAPVRKRSL